MSKKDPLTLDGFHPPVRYHTPPIGPNFPESSEDWQKLGLPPPATEMTFTYGSGEDSSLSAMRSACEMLSDDLRAKHEAFDKTQAERIAELERENGRLRTLAKASDRAIESLRSLIPDVEALKEERRLLVERYEALLYRYNRCREEATRTGLADVPDYRPGPVVYCQGEED